MKTDKFNEIKNEIISRAKKALACKKEYVRAYKSKTLAELMQVVKDNFAWVCEHRVITTSFIEEYEEEFSKNNIWLNRDVVNGHLLCVDSSVKAYGESSVIAYGRSSVEAYGHSSVKAFGRSSVTAFDRSSVTAFDHSSVTAYGYSSVTAYAYSSVEAYGHSSVKAYDHSSVEALSYSSVTALNYSSVEAYDHSSVIAFGRSSVTANGRSSVTAFGFSYVITIFPGVECSVFDHAIHRALPENKIYYASDSIEFVKQ